MSYSVRNLFHVRADWEIYSVVKDDVIVVRARPRADRIRRPDDELDFVITELHWKTHLHRPEQPLSESILRMIGERMADLVRDALATGYLQAQLDIRKALGL